MMTPDERRRLGERLHAFVTTFDPPLSAGGPTLAVKDLIDVAGVPTGGGGVVPLDPAPACHATVVQRLIDAGYGVVGKTHTVELACGGWGTNRVVGAPWNPWDPSVHRAPGGSSSGSAVAVAAGLCDVALGTDTGGSVRIPAAACGVVGIKPGRGLVSTRGVHDLAPSLDTVGVLARSVADAAQALAAMSGPDDGFSARPAFDAAAALATPVKGWRVAALPLSAVPDIHPDVAAHYEEALRKLRALDVVVEEARLPRPFSDYFAPNGWLMTAEGWRVRGAHVEAHGERMDPWIRRRFEAGREVTDAQLAQAQAQRAAHQAEFGAWMASYHALVSPTSPIPAPPIAEADETTSPFSAMTRAGNYLDISAANLPIGLAKTGMPIGFQVMGGDADETSVVALAAALERVSGWNGRMPDLSGFS
ncbi:aspartyl-tRNA(Asn)/glutamyl-tRNA(Gln) amidotransferase subunit A [Phenylobacterium koreense]|uniref:Aspartyl-tRNA(Asn)/glutamyl-tRNA(Gln) amidotransferase subunit A n=4 Tax=Phenylobacterium TaxID=20 RepID=A0ABV2EKV2_9CAUL